MTKILSLFDGMSCGQQAITNLGITDYIYFASEIDKYAIQVTQKNFPNTIQVGDVTKIKGEDYKEITLLCGGSPCQGFSFAGKQLNFEDERSKLFFEYVRILNEIKPKYLLLENVRMKKEYQDVISEHLYGIQPVIINSSLLTAQNRVRLYWVGELQQDGTYKQVEIEQPQDKGILLKDILEDEVDDKYNISEKQWNKLLNYESNSRLSPLDGKSYCLNTMQGGHRQPKIAYAPGSMEFKAIGWKENKSPTLCARDYKDPKVVMQSIIIPEATKKGYIEVSPGECFDYTQPNSKTRRGRSMKQKSNCMTAGNFEFMNYDGYKIRKLTPTECERLQGVKDNYTDSVSNSQRYKMLGNGWTVPVIEHIFKYLIKE